MIDLAQLNLEKGTLVRITQTVNWGLKAHQTVVEGEILSYGKQATGSWFAHGADDKLWMDRIEFRKTNGELCKINVDRNTQIEVIEDE